MSRRGRLSRLNRAAAAWFIAQRSRWSLLTRSRSPSVAFGCYNSVGLARAAPNHPRAHIVQRSCRSMSFSAGSLCRRNCGACRRRGRALGVVRFVSLGAAALPAVPRKGARTRYTRTSAPPRPAVPRGCASLVVAIEASAAARQLIKELLVLFWLCRAYFAVRIVCPLSK